MVEWQTDLPAMMLDLLNFIEEQVQQALENPTDQLAAVDAAAGVIPLIRERIIGTDHGLALSFMLTGFERRYAPDDWRRSWKQLAKRPTDEFREAAKVLLEELEGLKGACRAYL